jgi:integrase
LPELREHVRRWSEPGSHGRVFVGPKGATSRRTNFSQLWKSAAAKAGVDPAVGPHFHDLRHTGNQLTKGAHLKDVMRRLGYSSTRAALIYQHPDRDSERAIAAGLSDTITAALADASGHVAGTEDPDVASGTQPDDHREVG